MYHTNAAYKQKVTELPQNYRMEIEVVFDESTGLDSVTIPPEDIFEAGFSECMFLNTFYVGSSASPSFWVRIFNKDGKYRNDALATAEIRPRVTLYDENDTAVDTVPIGIFYVERITVQNSDLRLDCIDKMRYTEKPYTTNGPGAQRLYQILQEIAQSVRGNFVTTRDEIPSLGALVDTNIFTGYSKRQVIERVAEICGSFAIFNPDGDLELRWFKPCEAELRGDWAKTPLELNGNTFSLDGNVVQVTGVRIVNEDTELARVGTDEYMLTVNENPIASRGPEVVAQRILERMADTKYIPCKWQRIGGDPSLQLGDIITIVDNKETYNEADYDKYDKYPLYMTARSWRFNSGGFSDTYTSAGNAERDLNTDRGMTTSKRISQLAKRVTETDKTVSELSDRETALLLFNEKMFNAMGLYKTVKDSADGSMIVYYHDENDLESSQTIYMFSAAGFAWTTDGWNNGEPLWNYGFTNAGDAILNTIHAYVVSADLIKTGLLQSQNGASWINMDNGTFCFGSDAGTALALDENKQLNVYGQLRSLEIPWISVYIGKSNTGLDAFVVNDSHMGDLMSVSEVWKDDAVLWSVPMFDKSELGLYFLDGSVSLQNGLSSRVTCETDRRAYITNDTAYIGVYQGDIEISTKAHEDSVWINFYAPKYGNTPPAYKFGDGTEGGYADIWAKKIILGGKEEFNVTAEIHGDTAITGNCWANNFYNNSSKDLKTNIRQQNVNALSLIKLLKFYSYDYNTELNKTKEQTHVDIGLVAEESPKEIKSEDGNAINLYEFISLTAKAVQELTEKVEQQAQEIVQLKTELSALKK